MVLTPTPALARRLLWHALITQCQRCHQVSCAHVPPTKCHAGLVFRDSWYHVFMEQHLGFVAVQQRNGTVTIPAQARRTLGLDQPGAQVEVVLRDGELVLVPYVAVPAEAAWFWNDGHQAAEREADADRAAGRHTDFDTAEQLLAHLENLDRQGEAHG